MSSPGEGPGPPSPDIFHGGALWVGPQGGLPSSFVTCSAWPCPLFRQALMSSVLHFCFLMPGLVFSLCTLNVVTDSMLTKAVSASDTGEPQHPRFLPIDWAR